MHAQYATILHILNYITYAVYYEYTTHKKTRPIYALHLGPQKKTKSLPNLKPRAVYFAAFAALIFFFFFFSILARWQCSFWSCSLFAHSFRSWLCVYVCVCVCLALIYASALVSAEHPRLATDTTDRWA